ncbi:MAG: M23 family metallopeptidase [Bacteriovoracales bacterium]|nr:M23 family metallopeptidase [Bacteriovoracales bacterium]
MLFKNASTLGTLIVLFCGGISSVSSAKEVSLDKRMPKSRRMEVYQGHGRKLEARVPRETAHMKTTFLCAGKETYHRIIGDRFLAFISVGHKDKRKGYPCFLRIDDKENPKSYKLFRIVVKKFRFKTERLNVAKKYMDLNARDLARWKREVALQKKVYASGVKPAYFKEKFMAPMKSVITSPYGFKRVFNDKRESWHLGTDFRGSVGTPLRASNRGKVVFVGDLFFNGKTIIIDHGMNIFTMYCHLSEIKAPYGQVVEKDAVIGLVGATGRVTGPHLHWGLKVDRQWVNGLAFLGQGI